jgi:DinB superfamily
MPEQVLSEPMVSSPALAVGPPEAGEYAPYYGRYISLVPGADLLQALDTQRRQTMLLLCGRDEADGDIRYEPGKWSVREVLGHLCDTERIMAYRALRIARGDRTPIEGYEQDDYVRNSPTANRALPELIDDYLAVRRATMTLFRNFDESAWERRGVANKCEISVRALGYVIAGHELHHRRLLEEKYFAAR